jgi:hypothetical protein
MALIQASASRGSSALEKVGGFIPMNWAYVVTWLGPSWLAPCGGPRFICWGICYCVYRYWRSTSIWVAMKASDGVMGGGGSRLLLPVALNPLGELRVGPTIWNASLYWTQAKMLLINDDKCNHA